MSNNLLDGAREKKPQNLTTGELQDKLTAGKQEQSGKNTAEDRVSDSVSLLSIL